MRQPPADGSTVLPFAGSVVAPVASRITTFKPTAATLDAHYRADVDGLRAIAVIPVVFFHAGFVSVSGGFVGVDVFFVISGFLITGILAHEMAIGRYSILEFYRRRARRIFPALTAVTLATLAAAYFIVTPTEYVELAKSAAAVSVFSSNIYFWKSASYFQSANDFRPLLHTWSLAVEEQYYLLFPLLLRLLYIRGRNLAPALALVGCVSLAVAVAMVPWKPNAAFYLLPTRAWELMIGGILAIGALPRPGSRGAASLGSALGIMLIAVPMLKYTAATPFPGLAAIPPALGTSLIIWAGGQGIVADILSERAAVAVGKASYSIYLWHVPLLAFGMYFSGGPLSTAPALMLCFASIGIGFASLSFIERPFRSPALGLKANRAALLATIGMFAVALISVFVILSNGLPGRMNPEEATLITVAGDKYRHHAECMTVDQHIVRPDRACHLGTPNVPPTVLLWGDSHSMVTATALEQAALREHASFLFAADADCPPGLGFEIDQAFDRGLTSQLSYRYCAKYNDEMLNLALHSPKITTVILSARWTNWRIGEPANPAESESDIRLRDREGTADSLSANKRKWERGFLDLVEKLAAAGKKIVIVGPLPEPTYNVPHRLYVQRFGFSPAVGSIRMTEYYHRHRTILRFFDEIRGKSGISFVWPARALCSAETCPVLESGHAMYFDHDHLSVYGAEKTSALYDAVFK